ncbi:hypothetical protein CERZMDRAFT_107220, partial [Cercospora zeae-maydis SCOH1-5]
MVTSFRSGESLGAFSGGSRAEEESFTVSFTTTRASAEQDGSEVANNPTPDMSELLPERQHRCDCNLHLGKLQLLDNCPETLLSMMTAESGPARVPNGSKLMDALAVDS